jgi:hypothetical protein
MSDTFYQERARKRRQLLWSVIAVILVVVFALLARRALLYDSCTRSLDRTPQSVLTSYLAAVVAGNQTIAQDCWEHDAYYDLAAGCSEICLSRAYGHSFDVKELSLSEVTITSEGRQRIDVTVTLVCDSEGQSHTGQVTLDSVGSSVPWKHWAIIESSVGGTAVRAWCP